MSSLKKLSGVGMLLLLLNEIRGAIVVAALLSGGAQALAQDAGLSTGPDPAVGETRLSR